MKKLFFSLIITIMSVIISFGQLPVWPIVTADTDFQNPSSTSETPHQYIDWQMTGSPVFTMTGPTAHSKSHGTTQAGINDCGDLLFFVMHNGTQDPNSLEVFDASGNQLNLSPANMNANKGDDEIQVVKRPGYLNQYYVIYSIRTTYPNSTHAYNVSNLAYSLIEVDALGTTANYVTIAGTLQKDIILTVGGIAYKYIHGKAVSRTSVTALNGHDLYVQRRNNGSSTFSIDRFEISSNGIVHSLNSGNISGYWWYLMVAGSHIELSPDESHLAVMARTDHNNEQEIYVFNISSGNISNMQTIKFSELLIEPDVINASTTGYNVTPGDYANYNNPNSWGSPNNSVYLSFLDNFERKITTIEFSPDGNYLYFVGGGYSHAYHQNLTYLGQIDIANPYINSVGIAKYIVRLQIQEVPNWDIPFYGEGDDFGDLSDISNSTGRIIYYNCHPLARIQSSLNGNLYFSKNNEEELYVLPNPNSPMPVCLIPGDVNFGASSNPNISTNGYVILMPDQIDGYNYYNSSFQHVNFLVSNNYLCSCDTLTFDVINHDDNTVYATYTITECPTEIQLCVEENTIYDLVGNNGVVFNNAISSASVIYPTGQNSFNFGNGGSFNSVFNTAPSTPITSDEIWEGKWYIPDNVIVTVDNATLDLTNCDLVFGECAGFDFINGASLRANNSVFRPCEIHGSWRGLVFDGKSKNGYIINESTFKNAQVALFFKGNSNPDIGNSMGVVSNNLFSNCYNGVRVSNNSKFIYPISGNRFVIDNFKPTYENCEEGINVTNNELYGIYTINSRMRGGISHNQFIMSIDNPDTNPFVYGIYQLNSGGFISENSFANIYSPITIEEPVIYTSIDNNEIEHNKYYYENNYAISIFDDKGTFVELNYNEINNSVYIDNIIGQSFAIYIANSNHISVNENNITGYKNGITTTKSTYIQLTNNIITNCYNYGISVKSMKNSNIYVTCNSIDMNNFDNSIGIYVGNVTDESEIHSNCIMDCSTSIYLKSKKLVLPIIRNNYLYNYYKFGIYNNGYSGNIGTNTTPGQNTLYSNHNSSIDIYSTSQITVADNYGQFNISWPTVGITSNNPYHSTASCGHQIYNMPSQGNLDLNLECDNTANIYPKTASIIIPRLLEYINTQEDREEAIALVLTSNSFSDEDNQDLISELYSISDLTENEKLIISYYSNIMDNKWELALNDLTQYSPRPSLETWYNINLINLNLSINGVNSISQQDIDFLDKTIIEEDDYVNLAISVRNQLTENIKHVYFDNEIVSFDKSLTIKNIKEDDKLYVYPNPAKDIVNFDYIVDYDENAYIEIYDMTGRIVTNFTVNYDAAKISIDISNLKDGIYSISIINNINQRKTANFIKE